MAARDLEGRNERRRKNYAEGRKAAVEGYRYWGQEEDRAITSPERPTDRELAVRLGRSVQAIQLRRYRLGGSDTRKDPS